MAWTPNSTVVATGDDGKKYTIKIGADGQIDKSDPATQAWYNTLQDPDTESAPPHGGDTYGTHEPGTGAPLNAIGNAAGGFALGAGAGFLYGGPGGAVIGAGAGAADGYKAGSSGTTIANQIAGEGNKIYNAIPGSSPPPAAPPPSGSPVAASQNLGAFDPNAPLPDAYKITPGTITAAPAAAPPTVTAPPPVTPPSLDFNTGLTAPQITSVPTAGTIPVVSAPQLGAGPTLSAGGVGGGSITAQNIDPSAATATPVANVTTQGVGRDAETQGLDYLRGVAEGTTTTAADKLLQKGVDENVGAAYGLAASLQGRNPGQALRQGLTSARTAIAKSSADIGAQKAQEQEDAMKQYATLGTSIAGQDLQAAMSNQSKDLQLSVSQMQAKIDVLKANQAAQLSAGEASLASQTQAQIATLQAQTSVATAQLQASTARDIANQTAQLDASKANAANQVATQIATLQAQVQVQVANLQAATSTQNTQAEIDANKAIEQYKGQISLLQQQQDQLYQAAKDNAANATTTNVANASNATQTSIAQAQLAEKAKADENTMDAQLKQLGLQALVAQLNAAIESAKTDQQRQAAEDQFLTSVFQTTGKIISSPSSGSTMPVTGSSNESPTNIDYGSGTYPTGNNGSPIID